MKKILALLAVACMIPLASAAPLQWNSYEKGVVTQENGVYTVKTTGRMQGMRAIVRNVQPCRYILTAMVRGQGSIRVAANGCSGWAYNQPYTLTAEWQPVKVSYFETGKSFYFAFYNHGKEAITFEVKDIKLTTSAMPCASDADIPGILYRAVDYPGNNGKLQKKAGALNGKALWGKRYYNMVTIPVPTNSKAIYYYVHTVKNNDKNIGINLRCFEQTFNGAVFKGAANQWQWVKIGPIQPRMIYPSVTLNVQCDTATQLWIDKVVLSTDGALSDDKLNALE